MVFPMVKYIASVAFVKGALLHHHSPPLEFTIMDPGTIHLLRELQRTNWIAATGITVRPQAYLDRIHLSLIMFPEAARVRYSTRHP